MTCGRSRSFHSAKGEMTSTADIVAAIAALDPSEAPAILSAGYALMAKAAGKPAPELAPEPDELLDVERAAVLLKKSRSWLYHNHRKLPFTVRGIGDAPRFSRKGLEKYIAGNM
jgi:hypothetical protein